MAQINPYLTFNGTCEAAFNFYKSVFGVEFQYLGRFNEMPQEKNCQPISPEVGNLIMHVSLPISKETTLFGSDSSDAFGQVATVGNNISISINASNRAEAEQLFNGLSLNGKITMPLQNTFWGAFFGMLEDQFGINWMVNCDENPQ